MDGYSRGTRLPKSMEINIDPFENRVNEFPSNICLTANDEERRRTAFITDKSKRRKRIKRNNK